MKGGREGGGREERERVHSCSPTQRTGLLLGTVMDAFNPSILRAEASGSPSVHSQTA